MWLCENRTEPLDLDRCGLVFCWSVHVARNLFEKIDLFSGVHPESSTAQHIEWVISGGFARDSRRFSTLLKMQQALVPPFPALLLNTVANVISHRVEV